MNIINRDGKTFIEYEIPCGKYCGDCFAVVEPIDLALHSCLITGSDLDYDPSKRKFLKPNNCPSLKG